MDTVGSDLRCGGQGGVGWPVAALRGPQPNISPMAIAPAIRPGRSARSVLAAPPGLAARRLGDCLAVLQGQWKRDAIWSGFSGSVAPHPGSQLAPHCQPLPILQAGCSASRQPSPVVTSPALTTATKNWPWEPCAALVSSVRDLRFQQAFSRALVPLLGAEAERWSGPFTPAGSTSRVSACRPRAGSPAPAGRTGPLGGNAASVIARTGGLS